MDSGAEGAEIYGFQPFQYIPRERILRGHVRGLRPRLLPHGVHHPLSVGAPRLWLSSAPQSAPLSAPLCPSPLTRGPRRTPSAMGPTDWALGPPGLCGLAWSPLATFGPHGADRTGPQGRGRGAGQRACAPGICCLGAHLCPERQVGSECAQRTYMSRRFPTKG